MGNLTRSNIAYNLKLSPHHFEAKYDGFTIDYYFSSKLYKDKFIEKLEGNRKAINKSLSNRFNFNIQCDLIADLKLYSTTEKRGFLLYKDGIMVEWPNDITLNGSQMIVKN